MEGMRGYFFSRVFMPNKKPDPQTEPKELKKQLKKHIASELREMFHASRIVDIERADAEAQFNRLCDVLEKM
jgi:acyl-CoA thioesterase